MLTDLTDGCLCCCYFTVSVSVCVPCTQNVMHAQNGFTWIESIVMPKKQDYLYRIYTTTRMRTRMCVCVCVLRAKRYLFAIYIILLIISLSFSNNTPSSITICFTLKIHLYKFYVCFPVKCWLILWQRPIFPPATIQIRTFSLIWFQQIVNSKY